MKNAVRLSVFREPEGTGRFPIFPGFTLDTISKPPYLLIDAPSLSQPVLTALPFSDYKRDIVS
jgi:hypothetical protein